MRSRRIVLNDMDASNARVALRGKFEDFITTMDNTSNIDDFEYASRRAREIIATYRKMWSYPGNHGIVDADADKMTQARDDGIERWNNRALQ